MKTTRHTNSLVWLFIAVLSLPTFLLGCDRTEEDPGFARAERITHRSQLIGGPTALGEVGDYLIENDQIRLVVQDLTFNRGSGLFGGSLIDADLVRFDGMGNSFGGSGRDTFGELFPAFFLEMIDPDEIVIVNDGSNGEAAVLEVRGRGGEFVTMLRFFNQAMVNAYEASFGDLGQRKIPTSDGEPLVTFTARYILEPGARHVRLEAEMVNESMSSLTFPNRDIVRALDAFLADVDLSTFTVPTGTVLGFGALNNIFVPGIGYDIRFGMEDLYQQPIELPAIPGLVADMVATSGPRGISYGFATAHDPDSNFVYRKPEFYPNASPDDLLFLFYASGFAGVFTNEVPGRLAPSYCQPDRTAEEVCPTLGGSKEEQCFQNYDSCLTLRETLSDRFTTSHYFIVGTGDVASVREELYRIRAQETFPVTGKVLNDYDRSPVREHTPIFLYRAIEGASDDQACATGETEAPFLFNQAQTNREGYFRFKLPTGKYCYRVRDQGDTSEFVFFDVTDRPLNMRILAPTGGRIEGFVVDENGTALPAKFTVVGEYDPIPGLAPRHFLFDLSVREHWRPGEFVAYDDADLSPRRFIEAISFAGADGRASFYLRPGNYTVYVSRGAEYGLFAKEVTVTRGGVARVSAQIKRQVFAEGYLSADLHLHAQGSIDSGLDYNDRVISVAAEGVEVAVASDHNFISDYMPYIYRNNLQPWLRSIVGLELTTFEGGHFNAFPLRQDISEMNRGSIKWQNVPPQQIFDELRAMGGSSATPVIQVNHPRDSLLGYFNQHYVDPLTGVAELPINTATGLDVVFAAAASPNGPAFIETFEQGGQTRYRSTFSYDFDAIEIYNGKRIHLLEHYRMPFDKADMPAEIRAQLTDEQYEALPDQKGVILCDGDEVAYPGGLDDWFNFLNYPRPDGTYRKYTATGNSDSHQAGSMGDPEPGFPKNYIYVGHNDPQRLRPEELVDGIMNHRVIVTNGPYIDMMIDGQPLGSTVVSTSGQVTLDLIARAADWVGVEEFTLRANGEIVYEGRITLENGEWRDSITLDIDGDTWFVMQARGENNLFPVVQPAEVPQIDFEQVLGSLAGAFGFGGGVEGLQPSEVTEIRPLAFTNPIWVVDDSAGEGRSEFIPPSPPVARCIDGDFRSMEVGTLQDWIPFGERRLDAVSVPLHLHHHSPIERRQGELRDARVIFEHWFGHSH